MMIIDGHTRVAAFKELGNMITCKHCGQEIEWIAMKGYDKINHVTCELNNKVKELENNFNRLIKVLRSTVISDKIDKEFPN